VGDRNVIYNLTNNKNGWGFWHARYCTRRRVRGNNMTPMTKAAYASICVGGFVFIFLLTSGRDDYNLWKGVQEMTTVICPKCGTENPGDATNCQNCEIILKLELEHAENQIPISPSQDAKGKEGINRLWWKNMLFLE